MTRTAPLPPPVDHLTDDDAEIARALFETRKADHEAETRRPRLEVEARLSDGV